MILSILIVLAIISSVCSTVAILSIRESKKRSTIPLEVQMPGGMPIIALSNNGIPLNFLVDSGSNISHICAENYKDLNAELLGTYKDGNVQGLGANTIGITMCRAELKDILGNKYKVNLSVSEHLTEVADSIEQSTGVRINGLLGTDFLREYNCVIDFESLKVHPKK